MSSVTCSKLDIERMNVDNLSFVFNDANIRVHGLVVGPSLRYTIREGTDDDEHCVRRLPGDRVYKVS